MAKKKCFNFSFEIVKLVKLFRQEKGGQNLKGRTKLTNLEKNGEKLFHGKMAENFFYFKMATKI